jgi:hypothetical protein
VSSENARHNCFCLFFIYWSLRPQRLCDEIASNFFN